MGGARRTFWENVHPLASVELVQYKIHASLVNAVTFAEHNTTRVAIATVGRCGRDAVALNSQQHVI